MVLKFRRPKPEQAGVDRNHAWINGNQLPDE